VDDGTDVNGHDEQDAPGSLRSEFVLGDGVYLNGNSLGPLPRRARERIGEVVDREWGQDLIRGWSVHDWIGLPQRIGDRLGRLTGSGSGQIVVGDSTSVCLFKLAAAALRLQRRTHILTDEANFPTDLYVLESLSRMSDGGVELRRERAERIIEAIDDRTALVVLTHVDYKTGAMYDMGEVNAAAHRHGALVLWDLSHSTGAVPLRLDDDEADLAVGCTYKYLNGGPGAPAFCYVSSRLQPALQPAVSGWMGHAAPFAFAGSFAPAAGIRSMSIGTPEVLALSVLEASLEVFDRTTIGKLREQSIVLSELFIDLVEERCSALGFEVASPRDARRRGSHVALTHENGYAIMQALIARGVIGDFRAPNLIRFGFAPLFLRTDDVRRAVDVLHATMCDREWDREEYKRRSFVT
jgi:kynureninase